MSMLVNPFSFGVAGVIDDFRADCSLVLEAFPPIDEGPSDLPIKVLMTRFPLNNNKNLVKLDTVRKKFGAASYKFDTLLSGSVRPATTFGIESNLMWLGANTFTVEWFFRRLGEPSSSRWLGFAGSSAFFSYLFSYDAAANQLVFTTRGESPDDTTRSSVFDFDTDGVTIAKFFDGNFHHIAAVRDSSDVVTLYVDGLAGAVTHSLTGITLKNSSATDFTVGSAYSATNRIDPIGANQEELRVTQGVARYTAPFTPPTVQFGRNSTDDPDYASVKLLMGMNDFVGFAKGGTVKGAVQYTAAGQEGYFMSKFGMRRMFPGTNTNNAMYFPPDPEYNLLNSDFTIELFGVYAEGTAFGGTMTLMGCWYTTSGNYSWRIVYTGGVFAFQYSTDGTTIAATVNFSAGAAINTLYDLAVVRSGNVLYLYKDGVLSTTHSMAGVTIFDHSAVRLPLGILAAVNPNFADGLEGVNREAHFLKALRVSKGLARYVGSTYTVPSLPLPIPEPILSGGSHSFVMNDLTTPPSGGSLNFVMGP